MHALGMFASWCDGARPAATLVAIGLAGAAGSAIHCLPMCGPIAACRAMDRLARVPEERLCARARFSSAALPHYHAGRLIAYAAAGAVASAVARRLVSPLPGVLHVLPAAALLAAALMLAMRGLRVAVKGRPASRGRTLFRALPPSFSRSDFLLGAASAAMPCGLLHAALLTALSVPPGEAALAMLAFGLGTTPALILPGWLGPFFLRRQTDRWRRPALLVSAGLLAGYAVILLPIAL